MLSGTQACEPYLILTPTIQANNKIAFQSKAGHPRIRTFSYARTVYPIFGSYDLDLDLDPMTLIYELDLGILKAYPRTKMIVL